MNSYNTVSEALSELNRRGYSRDFNAQDSEFCRGCTNSGTSLAPAEFVIDEIHRFEGLTDPGDQMILYAISSFQPQIKGVWLSAYGVYGDHNDSALIGKLIFNYPSIQQK